MSRPLIPIANLNRRLPELGRIRTGQKTERAMKALSTFRFTSPDRTALEQIAELYKGTVKPWADDKAAPNQFEIITEATEIQVALPPDPLGGSPVYELWGGGGCERRCDGVTCETWVKGPEGPEPNEVACICDAKGELACDPKTRLNVILPNVRGIGTWRLETKSWNAAQELPGMVDLIQSLQAKGITRATLRLEHKQSMQAGVKRKFIVPVLGLDASVEALVAGDATVGALSGPAPVAQIGAGGEAREQGERSNGSGTPELSAPGLDPGRSAHNPPAPSLDDEPIEAEIVEDAPVKTRFHDAVRTLTSTEDEAKALRHAVIYKATDGATTNSQQASSDALEAACELLAQVGEGTWRVADERLVANSDWLDAQRAKTNAYPSSWAELTGPAKTKALKAARAIAEERGLDVPAAFDEVGPELAALVEAAA